MSDEITTGEAATLLGEWLGKGKVSTKTIYRAIRSRELEACKPLGNAGGHRISRAVLEAWYAARRKATMNRNAAQSVAMKKRRAA